jgi:hypothetical protein
MASYLRFVSICWCPNSTLLSPKQHLNIEMRCTLSKRRPIVCLSMRSVPSRNPLCNCSNSKDLVERAISASRPHFLLRRIQPREVAAHLASVPLLTNAENTGLCWGNKLDLLALSKPLRIFDSLGLASSLRG